jgi:hypothetical protein
VVNKALKETILELECKLQRPETRKEVAALDQIISDDLVEITSSGTLSRKSDCLANLPSAPEIKFEMTNFNIRELAPDSVQTFFETKKTIVSTGKISYSQRSSIWKNEAGKWKMIYHQGTVKENKTCL